MAGLERVAKVFNPFDRPRCRADHLPVRLPPPHDSANCGLQSFLQSLRRNTLPSLKARSNRLLRAASELALAHYWRTKQEKGIHNGCPNLLIILW